MELLVCWLICVACANGLWIVVFKSPLVLHLTNLVVVDELCTSTDLENYFIAQRWWFVHNLWICATCQAVWTSAFAAAFFVVYQAAIPSWLPVVFLGTLPFVKWTQKHL